MVGGGEIIFKSGSYLEGGLRSSSSVLIELNYKSVRLDGPFKCSDYSFKFIKPLIKLKDNTVKLHTSLNTGISAKSFHFCLAARAFTAFFFDPPPNFFYGLSNTFGPPLGLFHAPPIAAVLGPAFYLSSFVPGKYSGTPMNSLKTWNRNRIRIVI